MAAVTIHVEGLTEALDIGFSIRTYLDDNAALLTDEHPSSSHGLPVLVKDGVAYGPTDLPHVTLVIGNTVLTGAMFIESAARAGWGVRVTDVTR